jgi:hypothetical protein
MQKYVSQAVAVIFAVGAVIAFLYGKNDVGGIMFAAAGGTAFLPKAVGQ